MMPFSADCRLVENFLFRPLRGLSGGDRGNILSRVGLIGVYNALESGILASPFIGGVKGGEAGKRYCSRKEISWRPSLTLDSAEISAVAIVDDAEIYGDDETEVGSRMLISEDERKA